MANASLRNCKVVLQSVSSELTRITLRGELVAGDSVAAVHRVFLSWFDLFKVRLIQLDLADVSIIDEVGLALLGKLSACAEARGTRLDLINLPVQINAERKQKS
jgi:ABC-type transporter Mla MlaB component